MSITICQRYITKVLNYQCCMSFGVCTYKINIHFDWHILPIAHTKSHTSLYSYIIFDIFWCSDTGYTKLILVVHNLPKTKSMSVTKNSVFVNIYYFKINQNCLPWHFLFYVHYLLLFLELWIHSWFVWFHWVGIT